MGLKLAKVARKLWWTAEVFSEEKDNYAVVKKL